MAVSRIERFRDYLQLILIRAFPGLYPVRNCCRCGERIAEDDVAGLVMERCPSCR